MNVIYKLKYFCQRKIFPGFKTDSDSLVIDIGSGDRPFWRADVYLDKLTLGNNQRTSQTSTIHSIGKFINSDAEKMPFKNKVFDFSFCSHLLEHVEDPGKVINEIIRVSKAGYLEVPNGILEAIEPFDTHLWFVFYDGKKLIFYRKSKKFHDNLYKNGVNYIGLINKIDEPFIRFYWKKYIRYEIINDHPKKERYMSPMQKDENKSKQSFNYYIILVKLLRFIFYKNKSTEGIEKI